MLLQPRERGQSYLNSNSNLGYIQIMAEELQTNKDEVTIKLSGHKLDRKDWFGRSDPFLEMHKSTESGMYTLIHKTEVILCSIVILFMSLQFIYTTMFMFI